MGFNSAFKGLMEVSVVFREEIRSDLSVPTGDQDLGVGVCYNIIPINLSNVTARAGGPNSNVCQDVGYSD